MNDLISRVWILAEYDRQHQGPPGGARKIMAEAPAVDAVPVVHGRWVDKDFPYKAANANPRVTAICSKCGNIAHRTEHGYSIFSKYCPNCGAKMDGDA